MGLKAVVKLKDNIFWQDGSLVTSIDVVETILAAKNSSTVHGYDGVSYGIIKSIDVIDNKQFMVVFNEYSYDWKSLFNVIFPAKLLEDANIEDLFYEDVFGCGPFKLKEWVMGEYILLERNSFFSGKKPNIDAIKIIFNSDINYLLGMLKKGEIDVLSLPVDIDLLKEIEEDDSLNLMVKPGNLIEHLAICLKPENNSQ
jgi:peptide/nickel transport system substrate-binding protein